MKTALKAAAGLAVAALVLAAAAIVQVWFFRPFSIDLFFEKAFLEFALDDPETLSQLRLLEPLGIDFHNDELTDASPARDLELAAMARRNLESLRAYDREALDETRRLSYDVLEWFIQNAVNGEPFLFHGYPVNQLFGVHSDLPDFMLNVHQINDAETARDYVARLNAFPAKFGQVLEGLALRDSRGILPQKFAVDKVLAETRAFIAKPAEEHLLYTHLADRLGELESVTDAERQQILSEGQAAVRNAVIPAYQRLIAHFEGLAAKVTANDGAWALPDGERYYAWCVRNHTTTDLTPQALHQIGLDEVGRIEAGMESLLRAEGYTRGTVGERLAGLSREERFLYPDTEESRQQILADYQAIIDDISGGLDPYFDRRPAAGVKVERVPEFREKTAPGAYYNPPPMDRSRPGVFYANLRDVAESYRWSMRTLAYHEAVPGHHFQIALAQELEGVPTFRKLNLFTAYVEGWALYSERLGKELGYFENPYDDLGRLQAEMFRAVRLVVDTGLHHKRWTREQAIEYMRAKTGQPEGEVVAEIERYIVMPGQALAYKAGMMKILELRERARQRLGPDFLLRDFHNVVLEPGALPLDVLEAQVERWLASRA